MLRNLTITAGLRITIAPPVYEGNGIQTSPNIALGDWMNKRGALAAAGESQALAGRYRWTCWARKDRGDSMTPSTTCRRDSALPIHRRRNRDWAVSSLEAREEFHSRRIRNVLRSLRTGPDSGRRLQRVGLLYAVDTAAFAEQSRRECSHRSPLYGILQSSSRFRYSPRAPGRISRKPIRRFLA